MSAHQAANNLCVSGRARKHNGGVMMFTTISGGGGALKPRIEITDVSWRDQQVSTKAVANRLATHARC